jgi:hypothetical protein
MYRKLNQSTETALGYHVSGTLTQAEIQEMQREMEAAIQTHGRIRVLIEIGDLDMPDPAAVLQDIQFAPHYLRDISRFAIVGNQRWQEWASRGANLLSQGEVRYFDSAQLPQAWSWVTS